MQPDRCHHSSGKGYTSIRPGCVSRAASSYTGKSRAQCSVSKAYVQQAVVQSSDGCSENVPRSSVVGGGGFVGTRLSCICNTFTDDQWPRRIVRELAVLALSPRPNHIFSKRTHRLQTQTCCRGCSVAVFNWALVPGHEREH